MAETHRMRTADQLPKSSAFATWNEEAEALAKACKCAEMPSMVHLTSEDYNHVYEPADDTYLLLDGLGVEFDGGAGDRASPTSTSGMTSASAPASVSVSGDSGDIQVPSKNPADKVSITLELGCGTGAVTTYLAKLFYERRQRKQKESIKGFSDRDFNCSSSAMHYVTDVNQNAVAVALRTAKQSGLPRGTVEPILCDLASPLLDKLSGKVDVLIFNPPYVPTPDDEVGSTGIEASWAGGKDGRVVLDRALPQIARLLSKPHGAAYVITVDDNLPEDIAHKMKEYGIQVKPLVRRKARNEILTVQKFTHILVP
jgi:release factor glutamine methyltransferase